MSEKVKEEGTFKIKRKPKKLTQKDEPIKLDLSKPKTEETDAIQVGETKKVDVGEQTGVSSGVDKQVLALEWTNKYQSPKKFLKIKKKNK